MNQYLLLPEVLTLQVVPTWYIFVYNDCYKNAIVKTSASLQISDMASSQSTSMELQKNPLTKTPQSITMFYILYLTLLLENQAKPTNSTLKLSKRCLSVLEKEPINICLWYRKTTAMLLTAYADTDPMREWSRFKKKYVGSAQFLGE
ncbi:hypothetical protein Tco_0624248 [Tanacetum coccineum]|uniref:Uncharacterized protein n=1 Tax=Tanacetum coccineum TaxID=301880 RepID=A0ABQ4WDE2_9ASTR